MTHHKKRKEKNIYIYIYLFKSLINWHGLLGATCHGSYKKIILDFVIQSSLNKKIL